MPKKKTINTNGIICLRQNSKIPFQTKFPLNMVNGKGDELPIFPVHQEAAAGSQESGGT